MNKSSAPPAPQVNWHLARGDRDLLGPNIALRNFDDGTTLKTRKETPGEILDFVVVRLSGAAIWWSKMSFSSRPLTTLVRTARIALQQRKGINPVHYVFRGDRNGVRGLATVFERTKPHVNIGMRFYHP